MDWFLSISVATLAASLLLNILTCKETITTGEGSIKTGFLMRPHRLTNFEIQKYYQTETKLNGAHAKTNLPKIQDGAYVINLN